MGFDDAYQLLIEKSNVLCLVKEKNNSAINNCLNGSFYGDSFSFLGVEALKKLEQTACGDFSFEELQALNRRLFCVKGFVAGNVFYGYQKENLFPFLIEQAHKNVFLRKSLKKFLLSQDCLLFCLDDGCLKKQSARGFYGSKTLKQKVSIVCLLNNDYASKEGFKACVHELRHVVVGADIALIRSALRHFVNEADALSTALLGSKDVLVRLVSRNRWREVKRKNPEFSSAEVSEKALLLAQKDVINLYLSDMRDRFLYFKHLEREGVLNLGEKFYKLVEKSNGYKISEIDGKTLSLAEEKTFSRFMKVFSNFEEQAKSWREYYKKHYGVQKNKARLTPTVYRRIQAYFEKHFGSGVRMTEGFVQSLFGPERGLLSFAERKQILLVSSRAKTIVCGYKIRVGRQR